MRKTRTIDVAKELEMDRRRFRAAILGNGVAAVLRADHDSLYGYGNSSQTFMLRDILDEVGSLEKECEELDLELYPPKRRRAPRVV